MTNYYYGKGSEVVYFAEGNCGNGSGAGHFQITPHYEFYSMRYGIDNYVPVSYLEAIQFMGTRLGDDSRSVRVDEESEIMTSADAVEELQVILDDYKRIRFKIENKLFMRKKTRRSWLEDNQMAIDALCVAIDTMQRIVERGRK